jgi:mono/diheme cytochrome c family protein
MRFLTRRLVLPAAAFLGCLALLSGCASARKGEKIFAREKCGNCHRFRGGGGNLAPDLTAVTEGRSDDWIKGQITGAGREGRRSRMPAFDHLSGSEIRALLAYLKS